MIVDAHHHVWRLERTPWLAGPLVPRIFGDYRAIRRDYLIEEFAADARAHGVTKSVHIQANVAAGEAADEVAWASASGARADLVQAVVGFADLAAPDLGDALDRMQACGTLRGVRQQLHWHENPAYRFAPAPDAMLAPAWRRGLAQLCARGLIFELQVFPGQFEFAASLLDEFPQTTFVLLHAGMLEDRSAQGWAFWRAGLRALAARGNLYVKLSGLGTFTRGCKLRDWRPVIQTAIETFGPGRCMFGSNFPVEKLWTGYARLMEVFSASLAGCSAAERRDILHDVACRLYRI